MPSRTSGCTSLLICAALALTIGIRAQPGRPQPRSTTGLIVGQVVDANGGRPIGGAIVTIGGPTPGISILTGSDGRFVFRDLPAGSFSIFATKPGYAPGAYGRRLPAGGSQQVTLSNGQRVGDAIVQLWKHGAITGIVIDEAGEAVVNVRVRAFRRATLSGRRWFVGSGTATTDDRGVYRFGHLIPGDYIVATTSRQVAVPVANLEEIARTGRGGLEVGPLAAPGTADTLRVGDTIVGIGRGTPMPTPLADGRMLVYPATSYPSDAPLPRAVTIPVAAGQERTGIDLQIRPVTGARLSGSVVGPEGPVSGVAVRLVPAIVSEIDIQDDAHAAVTDNTGAFLFPGVPSGAYSLRVIKRPGRVPPGGQQEPLLWADVPLAVAEEHQDGVTVALEAGLRISGRMEFIGTGPRPSPIQLRQIPIQIDPADGVQAGPSQTPVRANVSGDFTSVGLPPGRYLVRIGDSPTGWMFRSVIFNGRDVSDSPIELRAADASGLVITFTDRWTGLRGVARSSAGMGDQIANVLVFPTDVAAWTDYGPSPRRLRSARTNRNGEYSFTSLPPGDYYVVSLPEEQTSDWRDPKFLDTLSRLASRVTINEGEQRTHDIRTQVMR